MKKYVIRWIKAVYTETSSVGTTIQWALRMRSPTVDVLRRDRDIKLPLLATGPSRDELFVESGRRVISLTERFLGPQKRARADDFPDGFHVAFLVGNLRAQKHLGGQCGDPHADRLRPVEAPLIAAAVVVVGVDGAIGFGLANLPVRNHEGVPGSRQGPSAPASQWTVTARGAAHFITSSISTFTRDVAS